MAGSLKENSPDTIQHDYPCSGRSVTGTDARQARMNEMGHVNRRVN